MIFKESKIIGEKYVDGYFLTIHDLKRLVRDFQSERYDGLVSIDESHIKEWMKKHDRIVDKGDIYKI